MEHIISPKKSTNFHCIFCDYKCIKHSDLSRHTSTRKHIKRANGNDLETDFTADLTCKNTEFTCKHCNITCNRVSEWTRHVITKKHQKNINNDYCNKNYNCGYCNKIYKTKSGLWKHNKTCNDIKKENEIIDISVTDNKDQLIETLIKENSDFKNMVLEVVKSNQTLQQQMNELYKSGSIITNNSYTNNNNKTFNLQFFLNEQCKDAMNITDFINSVTLSLTDLENMGTSGYVNGISSIIIKELRGLDITKRPVHCSDAKRETLYIKDEDKWEKECPENTKMKTAIRTVEKKNIKLISEWTDKHPKFTNSTTKENDEYLQILIETMDGKGDYEKNKNKVIKNIAREVVISKDDI